MWSADRPLTRFVVPLVCQLAVGIIPAILCMTWWCVYLKRRRVSRRLDVELNPGNFNYLLVK